MTSMLRFTLLCDDVRLEASGKLTLIGLYNYVIRFQPMAQPFPSVGTVTRYALPQLCVLLQWNQEAAGKNASVEIIGPNGVPTARADVLIAAPTTPGHLQVMVRFLGLAFDEGNYVVRTVCGASISEEPFFVSTGGGTPGAVL
jgi:hypothetical protein